jgi:hypothetical protein
VIEPLVIVWPARNEHADQIRADVWAKDANGIRFKLRVVGESPSITILDVVQWWENYLGPCDMLKGIELTL